MSSPACSSVSLEREIFKLASVTPLYSLSAHRAVHQIPYNNPAVCFTLDHLFEDVELGWVGALCAEPHVLRVKEQRMACMD